MFVRILTATTLALACSLAAALGVYQEPEDFLAETFSGKPPQPRVIWLTGTRKETVKELLGHDYASLRVRYWRDSQRSAWVLEKIGKDQPITAGIVISNQHIERIKVLIFRESRGWEIRHPFFTDQFSHARLADDRNLDRHIDGISGATLSVRAMQQLAKLALYLDAESSKEHVPQSP